MNKRAIIYARVSTDDQRNNYSIPSQVAECKKYIETKGYVLVGNRFVDPETGQDAPSGTPAFVDDYSSRELSRPALDAAYEYLEQFGYDAVVVYSIDRLDRDPYKLRTHEYGFIKGGASVEYVKGDYAETPDGQFMKTVVGAAAKLDNDWRTERFNRGKRQKARRGLYVTGNPPYGYRINQGSFGGVEVMEEEAGIIRLIFEAYVNERLSLNGIVELLNQRKVKTQKGGTWQKSSINHILNNTIYVGQTYYNKYKRNEFGGKKQDYRNREEWIEIKVSPIIEKELFEAAQEILNNNREYRRKKGARLYLLGGMVFCEACNRPYLAQTLNAGAGGRTKTIQYYRHRVMSGHCCNKHISASLIEAAVWEKVESLLLDPSSLRDGYNKALEKEHASHRRQLELREVIEREIGKLEQMQRNLTTVYTDPEIKMTRAEYLEQRNRIQTDLQNAAAKLQEVEAQLSNLPTLEEYESLECFAEQIKERLTGEDWQPTPINKRRIFELLNLKIYVDFNGTGRITGWFGDSIGFLYQSSSCLESRRCSQLPLRPPLHPAR
jgi:site-specific DNA recombinase